MKKRNILLISFCLILLITGVSFYTFSSNNDTSTIISSTQDEAIEIQRINHSDSIKEIYTEDVQNKIHETIQDLKKESEYTLDNPLVIQNPYGTNTTSLYLYFENDDNSELTYTVSAEGYNDFSRTLVANDENEYQLIGIVPDITNTISLELVKDDQIIQQFSFKYDAPALLSDESYITVDIEKGDSTAKLTDGLYTILGNDTTENDEDIDYMYLYDNEGTIRSEIPIISYRSHRILFEEDEIVYSASGKKLVKMNNLGQITKIYDMQNYSLHHDYIEGSQNDYLVLATESNTDTKEDKIISVDKETGDITELIDLEVMFENYRNTLSSDETLDWMHINSIELVNEDEIIISSRETSTIIKISDIYDNPTIDYMIGSDNFWQGSGYEDYLLEKAGTFSLQAGQHCVTYQKDDSLEDGQYYLYMYNNNNAICSSRDYNYAADTNYYNTGKSLDGNNSYYYKYLVDENAGTFTLVKSIPVSYSGYVSSVQEIDGNTIIDSGGSFEVVELDENDNVIQTITGTGDTWWYRVFKYTYEGFWFK